MGFDKNKIKELYPGAENMMIEPQLIHKSTDAQVQQASASGEFFGQEKIDGALYMFVKGLEGQTYVFGRTVSKKTGLLTEKSANIPHIVEAFEGLPNGTILLGEIYYPGGTSKDVTPIMGSLPDKAIKRQEGQYGFIHYYIYDTLGYNGTSLLPYDNWTRWIVTKQIFQKFHFDNSSYIDLATTWEDGLYEHAIDILNRGGEGMVFKRKTALYRPGKRPLDNLKVKQVDFIDAVISGFSDPVKEYTGKELGSWAYWLHGDEFIKGFYYKEYMEEQGKLFSIKMFSNGEAPSQQWMPVTKHYFYQWKNAIEVSLYNSEGELVKIGTVSSGLTDELREAFAKHPEDYIGKVVKLQCMTKDSKEKTLRHPIFLGFHDDKNPEEATIESVFG